MYQRRNILPQNLDLKFRYSAIVLIMDVICGAGLSVFDLGSFWSCFLLLVPRRREFKFQSVWRFTFCTVKEVLLLVSQCAFLWFIYTHDTFTFYRIEKYLDETCMSININWFLKWVEMWLLKCANTEIMRDKWSHISLKVLKSLATPLWTISFVSVLKVFGTKSSCERIANVSGYWWFPSIHVF